MGQATVNLPDPLENPKSAASINNADDLLAQLAGDEIDRLLAESDVERASRAEAEPAVKASLAGAPVVNPDHELSVEIDELFAEAQAQPAPAEVEKPPAAGEAAIPQEPLPQEPVSPEASPQAVVPSEAAALTVAVAVSDAVAPAEQPPVSDAHSPVPDSPVKSAIDDELDAATSASAERAALGGVELGGESLPELGHARGELPAVFKPLVWLSAPLDVFPDEVREALGKVAILTLVNAVAVLVYVMMFRRHH